MAKKEKAPNEAKAQKPLYKKWWFWVIVVSLVGAAGSGIAGGGKSAEPDTSQPPAQIETQPPASEPQGSAPADTTPEPEIDVTISVSVGGESGKPEFTISTNLPDETELMVTLKGGENYTGQTKAVVKDGVAVTEAFSSQEGALSGKYTLDVSMSLPRLQSENVRSIIGESGEYLKGIYVEKDDITGENWVNAESVATYEW